MCRIALALLVTNVFSAVIFAQQSGVDLKAIDKSANPCDNFYQYACGAWIKANHVPPE